MTILVINTGSTSTKVAVYEEKKELCRTSVSHSREELAKYNSLFEQLEFRTKVVKDFILENGITTANLDCIVARGGPLPNAKSGATRINGLMLEVLKERPIQYHASSLSSAIAWELSADGTIPAFIYDPISANERDDVAKITGVAGLERQSLCHVLNTRARGIETARMIGKSFEQCKIIVAHIGGGNSIALWNQGRLTDCFSSDEGPISAERCGGLRGEDIVDLCEKYGCEYTRSLFLGKGGMVSALGTNDLREVEGKIVNGDKTAAAMCRTMAYQTVKCIGALTAAAGGGIDAITFTGGGAYWQRFIDDCKYGIAYMNTKVLVMPGENEMKALAEGAFRVMRGEEDAIEYTE